MWTTMPTYEYKCLECGERSEAFQSMKDAPLTTCEACGGRLKRLIGAGAGVIFKGNGFYGTDYRSESYRTAAKKETAPEATTATKTATAPETKAPAPKPETTSK